MKFDKHIQILIIGLLVSVIAGCSTGRRNSVENQKKLIENNLIRGIKIPEGSRIEAQGDELMIYLSESTEIQGYLVRKRKHANDHCTIDKNGNLIFFVPQNDLSIDSIPCKGQEDVWLYPNGDLFMCHLANNLEHSGNIFPKGEFVMIDEKGFMKKHSWSEFNRIKETGLYPQNH